MRGNHSRWCCGWRINYRHGGKETVDEEKLKRSMRDNYAFIFMYPMHSHQFQCAGLIRTCYQAAGGGMRTYSIKLNMRKKFQPCRRTIPRNHGHMVEVLHPSLLSRPFLC
jgi:hypothetical protein